MTLVAKTLGLLTLLILTSCSSPILQNFGGEIYGTTYSIKIAENKNITESKKSDIPKNTLKLIEEAENSKI